MIQKERKFQEIKMKRKERLLDYFRKRNGNLIENEFEVNRVLKNFVETGKPKVKEVLSILHSS